jgi:DNA modification methylase
MGLVPGLRLVCGDAARVLATLPDASVNCTVCSPPYYGLRSYLSNTHDDKGLEIGAEATPAAYVERLLAVFSEVWRVLRDDGTLFVVLGDSYNAYNGNRGQSPSLSARTECALPRLPGGHGLTVKELRAKSLLGIPWRVAFALMDAGWILRNDAIWAKPSPMPESVQDRWTRSHEYVFFFTKQPRYAFDLGAILEPATYAGSTVALGEKSLSRGQATGAGVAPSGNGLATQVTVGATRQPRDVFTLGSEPCTEAHYAPFPSALVRPLILAGCPERVCGTCGAPWQRRMERASRPNAPSLQGKYNGSGGVHRTASGGLWTDGRPRRGSGAMPTCACTAEPIPGTVLDPFVGSGTACAAALALGRHAIGIDLNQEYLEIAERRCARGYYEGMHGMEHEAARPVEGQLAFRWADEEETG